ncbi:MAG: biotin/lipoyl-containing protein [Candidatus Omnitrophota bacterium]|jgi:pyruvate/2-oxoglutarate dehydrogenase complex dihydrolipoamide acyltransferase (E2) component
MIQVILPELGEGIQKATVSFWYFKAGDTVKDKESLVELTTDKAAFNLPSPSAGIISEVFFNEGDSVNIGEVLALIDESLQQ